MKLVGGSGGLNIPPQLLTAMMSVMVQFVPAKDREEFRKKVDEEVFPAFRRYAENWEENTGTSIEHVPAIEAGEAEIVDAEIAEEDGESSNGRPI